MCLGRVVVLDLGDLSDNFFGYSRFERILLKIHTRLHTNTYLQRISEYLKLSHAIATLAPTPHIQPKDIAIF